MEVITNFKFMDIKCDWLSRFWGMAVNETSLVFLGNLKTCMCVGWPSFPPISPSFLLALLPSSLPPFLFYCFSASLPPLPPCLQSFSLSLLSSIQKNQYREICYPYLMSLLQKNFFLATMCGFRDLSSRARD